jgi:adenylate kinase
MMSMEKPLNFVLIGRSGSGKGTQAKLLMEHFGNLYYISTGDFFRDLAKADTDVGERIRKILTEGGLPYDDLATTLWMHEIAYRVKKNEGIMADGFPRRLNEAKNLDQFLKFLERETNTFYILIDISREEAFNRLTKRRICKKCERLIPWVGEFKKLKVCDKCGGELLERPDDTPEAINNRLDYYEERVIPVVKYYEEQSKLLKINGEQSIVDVFQDILKAIKKR